MKKLIMVLCLFVALPALAGGEQSPAQKLKKNFVNGCVARGIQRNDDAVEATNFCTCIFEVLAKELTVQEYIDMDKASQENRSMDSISALVRVKAKILVCKK